MARYVSIQVVTQCYSFKLMRVEDSSSQVEPSVSHPSTSLPSLDRPLRRAKPREEVNCPQVVLKER